MPLVGISYRGYDSRDIILPVNEMLRKAAEQPWNFPYPYPLLKAMVESEIKGQADHSHGEGYVSATTVQAPCLRCSILKNNMDYVESVEELYPRFAGTRQHSIIEEHPYPNSINELRLAVATPNGKVTGKFDILAFHDLANMKATLLDLKNSASPPKYDKVKYWHNLQLQTYRYIINHASEILSFSGQRPWQVASTLGIDALGAADLTDDGAALERSILEKLHQVTVEHLAIIYALPQDMKLLEARKPVEVPTTTKGAKFPTRNEKQPDIWTDGEVENMLFPKVKQYLEAEQLYKFEGELPPYPSNVVDPVNWVIHRRYTPASVATACLRDHFKNGGK